MDPVNGYSRTATATATPAEGEIESPFGAAMTYAREEPGPEAVQEQSEAAPGTIESPFRMAYELEEVDGDRPGADVLAEFMAELHDEEFDEALSELANEAASLVETRLANGATEFEALQ